MPASLGGEPCATTAGIAGCSAGYQSGGLSTSSAGAPDAAASDAALFAAGGAVGTKKAHSGRCSAGHGLDTAMAISAAARGRTFKSVRIR